MFHEIFWDDFLTFSKMIRKHKPFEKSLSTNVRVFREPEIYDVFMVLRQEYHGSMFTPEYLAMADKQIANEEKREARRLAREAKQRAREQRKNAS